MAGKGVNSSRVDEDPFQNSASPIQRFDAMKIYRNAGLDT